jgi:hypothetical protein
LLSNLWSRIFDLKPPNNSKVASIGCIIIVMSGADPGIFKREGNTIGAKRSGYFLRGF